MVTNGPLPADTHGNVSDSVYVPNVGTVAAQGGSVTRDSSNQPSAPKIVQLSSSGVSLSDGLKATYAIGVTGLVTAASATDIFTIIGSATKTIRVTRLRVSAIKTTAGADVDILLIKRSADNTAGTSTSPTPVPYDSLSAAATAVVKAYTANPSGLGTAVGTLAVDSLWVALATAQTGMVEHTFGNRPAQAPVLRGIAQVLAVNLNGVTVGGGAFDIFCEWTEE